MSTNYGYIFPGQSFNEEQENITAMKKAGITEDHIYIDRSHKAPGEFTEYKEFIGKIKENDCLYIQSFRCLGSNCYEIFQQWNELREKKIEVVIMDLPLLDSRKKVEGNEGQYLTDVILQVLSYTGQIEREIFRQKQSDGIKAAQERGVRFGRPEYKLPKDFEKMCRLVDERIISGSKAAVLLGMPKSTFFKKRAKLAKKSRQS